MFVRGKGGKYSSKDGMPTVVQGVVQGVIQGVDEDDDGRCRLSPTNAINPSISITIVCPSLPTLSCSISPKASVLQLKERIMGMMAIPRDIQCLSLGGKLLHDEDFIKNYGIINGCTLQLILALPGGSDTSGDSKAAVVKGSMLKLPPYWSNDPSTWFSQVEAQFHLHNIKSQKDKYYTVVAQLPQDAASQMRDMINKMPDDEPYQTFKEALITRTAESAAQRISKALDKSQIGDCRPSQVLRTLERQLEGLHMEDTLLRQVFLQKLPTTIRTIVAAQSDTMKLSELSDLADRIHDNLPENVINSATSSSNDSKLEERMSRLEKMMVNLAQNNRNVRRKSPFQRQRSHSKGSFNPQGKFCYYHWRYGKDARKCNEGCKWKSNDQKNEKQQ